jgi:succinate-semialdehyde dehydrogenase/glutarate-semialdehyde dehydrogenase
MISDLYIDGGWISTKTKIPIYDPSDDSVISHISLAGEAEINLALDAAERGFSIISKMAPRVRAEYLRKAFEMMIVEADKIATLLSKENGKVFADAKGEVLYAAEFLRWFSEEAVRITGDFRTSPSGDKRIIVTQQPVGVSLLITPWNFPAAMITRKVGPALAAGCSVIIKPASETPLTALAIVDIFHRIGLPAGIINLVMAQPAAPAVSQIMSDSRVKNLSFTGSTEVGKLLIKQAADRVMRTSMELGGNAPFIVLDDADVDAAVSGAMIAKLRNGGSACTAANRIYVAKNVSKEFTTKFTKAMETVLMAPGMEPGAQLGSSVSKSERDKVSDLVDKAIEVGGKILTGGVKPVEPGAFYPPTVIEVKSDNPILSKEIFGPVAPIVTFSTDDEAITLANDTDYGLISYIYGGELRRTLRVAEAMESGMVAINRGVISDPAAPFGGYKESGIGREGGFAGITEFLETKYIGTDF